MDRDFKYNHERYYDPTVYMALNNVQKGEKMEQIKVGELWEYDSTTGRSGTALVLAINGDVVTILKLIDTWNNKHDLEIACRGRMYAGSSMITYGFVQNFHTFIRTMTPESFQDVMDKVAKSLGIDSKVQIKEVEKEVLVPSLVPSATPAVEDVCTQMELERTKAQLEVYKGLYENLMQQVMQKGA